MDWTIPIVLAAAVVGVLVIPAARRSLISDPLLAIYRRILPPMGRVDTASLVALLAVQITATLVLFRLRSGILMPLVPLIVASMIALAVVAIWFYIVLIVIYALLSFIAPGTYSPVTGLLASLCEPLLRPLRRILPAVGGLDFSPLVAIIALRSLLFLIA